VEPEFDSSLRTITIGEEEAADPGRRNSAADAVTKLAGGTLEVTHLRIADFHF